MLAAEKRISIILMLISLSFLLLTAPVFVLETFDLSFYSHPRGELVLCIAYALMYSNHVINFFLYCSLGPNFRNEVKRLFGRGNRIMGTRDFKLTRLNAAALMAAAAAAASTTIMNHHQSANQNEQPRRHLSRRMALVAAFPNALSRCPTANNTRAVARCLPHVLTTSTLVPPPQAPLTNADSDVNNNNQDIDEIKIINNSEIIEQTFL